MISSSLTILDADDQIVIVEKPGGLLAVPGRGPDKQHCVASELRKMFSDMIEQPAVHRLDMYTSGLMVFARTSEAHRHLSAQFAARRVEKLYIAELAGRIDQEGGRIELPFRLDIENRPRQIYDPIRGKIGITEWRRLEITASTTRIQLQPLTGRTHQLRTHCAHPLGLSVPIVGDSLYGTAKDGERMHLHASFLRFLHPQTAEIKTYRSTPPF